MTNLILNSPPVRLLRTRERSFHPCPAARRGLWALLAVLATQGAAVPALQAQTADTAAPMAVATSSPEAMRATAVNINSATASELAAGLKGVGPGKAEAIVRYREQFGAFESIDELAEVKGIGAATVEQNRSMIVLR